MTTTTIAARPARVTDARPNFMRAHTAQLRDADQQRAGQAMRVTLTLAGISPKRAERVLGRSQATVSRTLSGQDPTPLSRLREQVRSLARAGAFPAALVADLLADGWREAMQGLTVADLCDRLRALHREETAANACLDALQIDMLCGGSVDADALGEALLAQAARTVEMYAIHCELRRAR